MRSTGFGKRYVEKVRSLYRMVIAFGRVVLYYYPTITEGGDYMPASPDLGQTISRIVETIQAAGGRQFDVDIRKTIDLLLKGNLDVRADGLVMGLSAAQMLALGYSPDDAQRVIEAGVARFTQASPDTVEDASWEHVLEG